MKTRARASSVRGKNCKEVHVGETVDVAQSLFKKPQKQAVAIECINVASVSSTFIQVLTSCGS
jgi:hypothetical protein